MVELDRLRLERIGLTEDDLGPGFATADDIKPPLLEDDIEAQKNRSWFSPLQDFFLDKFSNFAREQLTGMYDDMGDNMGKDGLKGGGEFLAAVETAKGIDPSTKIVLGDRSSIVTIQRAAELALRSGDPLGVLNRMTESQSIELDVLKEKIIKRCEDEGKELDEKEFNVALVEALKNESGIRQSMFDRLEREVPEFTRAFVAERDYIMSEAIHREVELEAEHVVAIVGLAHVTGMAKILEKEKNFEQIVA